ncbi:MAG: TraB/GumN family protein [Deltaproteobacteria bacterium]|nr:TraB/GumN family protein [Deltaproteobacteria bacterium]
MPLFFKPEKPMKMIWRVQGQESPSWLVGTAHFFPYSFKKSLARYFQEVDTVLFEGPLDQESLTRVAQAGHDRQAPHLFTLLDRRTIGRLAQVLGPSLREARILGLLSLTTSAAEAYVHDLVQGMKPWMAFFTLWTYFLEKQGWRYSVDLEAYDLARERGKEIVFLETLEEQIDVLESLSREKIVNFLKQADRWKFYSRRYVKGYLAGDLEMLLSLTGHFPSRTAPVIQGRDHILYRRLRPFLEKGKAAACVGAPHVPGIRQLLHHDGCLTRSEHA